MSPELPARPQLDLDAIRDEFLNQCGPCDFGLVEYGCNCPTSDYRPPMSQLVAEVKRLRAELSARPVRTEGAATK